MWWIIQRRNPYAAPGSHQRNWHDTEHASVVRRDLERRVRRLRMENPERGYRIIEMKGEAGK